MATLNDSTDEAKTLVEMEQMLSSLREEYRKVQNSLIECEQKYEILQASVDFDELPEKSFVRRLVMNTRELFESEIFSDLTVILDGHEVPCHRYVLAARSDCWNFSAMANMTALNFDNISYNIGYILLKWIYTDEVDHRLDEVMLIELMQVAKRFKLSQLIERCERLLIACVDKKNCIELYKHAYELNAPRLMESAASKIYSFRNEMSPDRFDILPGVLLHELLESKFKYPLHEAILLQRKDAVDLCLADKGPKLCNRLNELMNVHGDCPLALALASRQEATCRTLIDHGADVDAKSRNGDTLLLYFLKKQDYWACEFLLQHAARLDCVDPVGGGNLLHVLAACKAESATDKEILDSLIQRFLSGGISAINSTDSHLNTPLHLSIIHDNMALFNGLMKIQQLDLEILNREGLPALWYALAKNDAEFQYASALVSRGANFNAIRPRSGDTLLNLCVIDGLLEAAIYLIKKGASVDVPNAKGETALYLASSSGLDQLVQILLNSGANPNVQTKENRDTPLHVAIRCIYTHVIDSLLGEKGSNGCRRVPLLFEIYNSNDDSALSLAISLGFYSVADKLIDFGADVNAKMPDGRSLLLRFISNGTVEGALYLIKKGCCPTAVESNSPAPLFLAIEHGVTSVVSALCQCGADLAAKNANGDSPLWYALCSNHESIADILVEHGADVDCWSTGPNGCMQTMLHRAIDENDERIACYLIKNKCDVNAIRKEGPCGSGHSEAVEKQTPLHMAATWGLLDVVSALIAYGASINAQDSEGKTPLHLAVINQHLAITERLLQSHHIDLNMPDKAGLTPFAWAVQGKADQICVAILKRNPQVALQVDSAGYNVLHNAIKKQDFELFLFLLSVRVDVNVRTQDSERLSPLHIACRVGNDLIIRNLLCAGSRINDTTSSKQTALHIAAQNDKAFVCSILLENKIDATALDNEGNNALHVAVQYGSLECIQTLLTESNINPFLTNSKGYGILHLLGLFGKENAASILVSIKCIIPNYPIEMPDPDGNTLLLFAFMNENYLLCREAIRAGACVGVCNRHFVSIFNYPMSSPKLLFRILDQLDHEPKWAEGDSCSECKVKFGITTRKHHCRHCGRLLCTKCSEHFLPILKYDIPKPVRVCNVCYDVLTSGVSQN
ncbi:Rabankyrin-5 [Trichinella pseudospiralis]